MDWLKYCGTQEQLNFFNEQGYLIIEDALNPSMVERLVSIVDRLDRVERQALALADGEVMQKFRVIVEDDIFLIDKIMSSYKVMEWNELIKVVANEIGTTQSSVKMRISNFLYIIGEKGLENYADISKIAIEKSLKKYTKSQLLIGLG